MKKKEIQEMHNQSVQELNKLGEKVQVELVQLRTDFGAGKLKNVHQIKAKKRTLARIKTILRQKELSSQTGNQTKK